MHSLHYLSVLLMGIILTSGKETSYSSSTNENLFRITSNQFGKWSITQSMGKNPDCWIKAYQEIRGSCLDMTREDKMWFSWRIMECYFIDTGRPMPACSEMGDIRSCTKDLSTSNFDIFTQFYNHGDSICFYRESKEWQERTDRSIQNLEDAAETTAELLSESILKEAELLQLQDANMALHRNSLQQGEQVLHTVSQTRESLTDLTDDMQRSIKAIQNETEVYFQRMSTVMQWTNEKLEALSAVQEILRRSFTDAHTLLSFTLKIVLVYFITAIPGISFFRLYLYIHVLSSLLLDKLEGMLPGWISYQWMKWIVTGLNILVCCWHLIYRVFIQKDWLKENNAMLKMLVGKGEEEREKRRRNAKDEKGQGQGGRWIFVPEDGMDGMGGEKEEVLIRPWNGKSSLRERK